jgi:hypothetical protein
VQADATKAGADLEANVDARVDEDAPAGDVIPPLAELLLTLAQGKLRSQPPPVRDTREPAPPIERSQ